MKNSYSSRRKQQLAQSAQARVLAFRDFLAVMQGCGVFFGTAGFLWAVFFAERGLASVTNWTTACLAVVLASAVAQPAARIVAGRQPAVLPRRAKIA